MITAVTMPAPHEKMWYSRMLRLYEANGLDTLANRSSDSAKNQHSEAIKQNCGATHTQIENTQTQRQSVEAPDLLSHVSHEHRASVTCVIAAGAAQPPSSESEPTTLPGKFSARKRRPMSASVRVRK